MDALLHIGLGNAVAATALALVAAALGRIARRPALAHALWLLVLLKLLTPPLVWLPLPGRPAPEPGPPPELPAPGLGVAPPGGALPSPAPPPEEGAAPGG